MINMLAYLAYVTYKNIGLLSIEPGDGNNVDGLECHATIELRTGCIGTVTCCIVYSIVMYPALDSVSYNLLKFALAVILRGNGLYLYKRKVANTSVQCDNKNK